MFHSHFIESGIFERVTDSLPKFRKPPVVEVALSVQFDELASFTSAHFGVFWSAIRERFPTTEHHPPLVSAMEVFGTTGSGGGTLQIESGFPVGRCWFVSEDGDQLIQLQPDRFVMNWRKSGTTGQYPSFEKLKRQFDDELERFRSFASTESLGELAVRQCEVTYVNHLLPDNRSEHARDVDDFLNCWSEQRESSSLPPVESKTLSWQYVMKDDDGIGRLHVAIQPARSKSDGRKLFVLQLIGRGAPLSPDLAGAKRFMDAAHRWIVIGFTDITRAESHANWERYQ